MLTITLDARSRRTREDFYVALLPRLGAPAWHGHNLDALHDSLTSGINDVEPPLAVQVIGVETLSDDLKAHLNQAAEVFQEAGQDLGVAMTLQMS